MTKLEMKLIELGYKQDRFQSNHYIKWDKNIYCSIDVRLDLKRKKIVLYELEVTSGIKTDTHLEIINNMFAIMSEDSKKLNEIEEE